MQGLDFAPHTQSVTPDLVPRRRCPLPSIPKLHALSKDMLNIAAQIYFTVINNQEAPHALTSLY